MSSAKTSKFYQKYTFNQRLQKKPGRKKSNCIIEDLPNELLLKVFSLLDINSLLNASCVSRNWRDLCSDNFLWETIFQRYWDRGSKLYTRLQSLSLSAVDKHMAVNWKQEFFGQCHSRIKQILIKLKRNPYTGVTDMVGETLSKYNIKFELSILDLKGTEFCFISAPRRSNKTSTIVQWNSLDKFPQLRNIKQLKVFALSPLVFGKDRLPVSNGPMQKSLLKNEEFGKHTESCYVSGGHGNNVTLKVSKSGFTIAQWKEANETAFIAASLHHHDLILKCFLSTAERIYATPKKTILDDIDPHYGLHGYQCHLNIHTLSKTLWEHKFSYLNSSKSPDSGVVYMQPDTFAYSKFQYSDFKWKTELFSGLISDFAFVDITLVDSNNSVMWADSYPVSAQRTASNDVSFTCDSQQLYMFQVKSEVGILSITFSKQDSSFIPQVLVGVSIKKINDWFGKNYK